MGGWLSLIINAKDHIRKMEIINNLVLSTNGTMRYTELQKAFDDAALTPKMLTQHLKELQRDNLVHRESFNVVPPKTEYSLTELGKSFVPVLTAMEDWGKHYIEECKKTM